MLLGSYCFLHKDIPTSLRYHLTLLVLVAFTCLLLLGINMYWYQRVDCVCVCGGGGGGGQGPRSQSMANTNIILYVRQYDRGQYERSHVTNSHRIDDES